MATLEERISALEDQVAQLESGETLSPSYLTIDPATGQVSANFSGTVAAHGFKFYDDVHGFVYSLQSSRPAGTQPQWNFLGPFWSDVKALGLTWGQVKALVGNSWDNFRKYLVQQRGI